LTDSWWRLRHHQRRAVARGYLTKRALEPRREVETMSEYGTAPLSRRVAVSLTTLFYAAPELFSESSAASRVAQVHDVNCTRSRSSYFDFYQKRFAKPGPFRICMCDESNHLLPCPYQSLTELS